jgi:DNA invertase Pin-like site-specific DNA recombinase
MTLTVAPPPLPRVVELIRVSTDAQKEKATHEVQRQALDALRVGRPGVVVKRLEALGVSGAKGVADRDDLKALLRLAASKAFDELRVYSVDRLTRSDDPRERFAVYGAARDAGALIIDCNGRVIDPADDSGMGEIDFYLQTMFASRERKKIMQRTMAGRKLKASQGKLAHGLPPYGRRFNRATSAWELVPQEVEVYKGIIEDCLAGKTMLQIARDLNKRGVPSRRNAWGYTSIQHLLKEPTIYGEYRSHGHVIQIPPICDRATAARIRASLSQRVTRPPETKAIAALLRGHMTCAVCGLPAWVLTTGANRGQSRYGCPKPSKRDIHCPDRRTMAVTEADKKVRDALVALLSRRELFDRALVAANGEIFAPKKAAKVIEADLLKLAGKESKTLKLYNEGFLTEDVAKRELAGIRAAREAAQEKQSQAQAAPAALPLKDLEAMRRQLAETVADLTAEDFKELLVTLHVSVKLGPQGLEISAYAPVVVVGYENRAAWKSVSVPEGVPLRVTLEESVPKMPLWWKHASAGAAKPEAATPQASSRAPRGSRARRASR